MNAAPPPGPDSPGASPSVLAQVAAKLSERRTASASARNAPPTRRQGAAPPGAGGTLGDQLDRALPILAIRTGLAEPDARDDAPRPTASTALVWVEPTDDPPAAPLRRPLYRVAPVDADGTRYSVRTDLETERRRLLERREAAELRLALICQGQADAWARRIAKLEQAEAQTIGTADPAPPPLLPLAAAAARLRQSARGGSP